MRSTLCVLLLLTLAHCSGSVSEIEPDNNRRKKAQEIRSDQQFEGTFYTRKGRDADFLFLRVDKGHMIRGNLSGVKGIDSEIHLFKKKKSRAFKIINDDGSSLGEKFGPIWIDPPGVVIAIRPRRNVNRSQYKELPYTFQVNAFAPSTPIEYEPNDSVAQAQEIVENTMLGYYSNVFASPKRLERDFFFVNIKESKKFSLKIELSGVRGIDPVMRIYNRRGERIKSIDERGVGQGESLLSYGIKGPNKLYLSINDKTRKINFSQYYEVTVSKSEHESKFELEPNDTRSRASLLKEEQTFGEVSDRHDIDYYKFTNSNAWPVQLAVKLIPEDSLNPRLELIRDKQKRAIVFDDGGKEENEGISNRIVQPRASVYLKVRTLDWEGTEPLPYEISLSDQQLVDNVEQEPNNRRRQANDVVADSSVVGYLNPNLDTDYFRLKTPKLDKFKILLDGIPNCRVSLAIADRYGTTTVSRLSKSMGDGISLTAVIESNGYIVVSCPQRKDNLYSSPYNLTIQSRATWEEE